jgi:hypothetical protein
MITAWDIYWITRLDGIRFVCTFVFVVSAVALIVWGLRNGAGRSVGR